MAATKDGQRGKVLARNNIVYAIDSVRKRLIQSNLHTYLLLLDYSKGIDRKETGTSEKNKPFPVDNLNCVPSCVSAGISTLTLRADPCPATR